MNKSLEKSKIINPTLANWLFLCCEQLLLGVGYFLFPAVVGMFYLDNGGSVQIAMVALNRLLVSCLTFACCFYYIRSAIQARNLGEYSEDIYHPECVYHSLFCFAQFIFILCSFLTILFSIDDLVVCKFRMNINFISFSVGE